MIENGFGSDFGTDLIDFLNFQNLARKHKNIPRQARPHCRTHNYCMYSINAKCVIIIVIKP